jgi:hypothetical protein
VAIVARDLERAPRTVFGCFVSEIVVLLVCLGKGKEGCSRKHTESLMRPQVDLARVQHIPQPLVGSVGDGRVDDQHKTGFETPPQSAIPVLAINHLLRRGEHALLLPLRLRLLPCRHHRDRNREHLRQSAGHSPQTQLNRRPRRSSPALQFAEVKRAHGRVPVKVGEVGAGHAEQGARHAAVQAADAFVFHYAGDGVQGAGVVRVFARVAEAVAGLGLDLDLQAGLDDVEGVDEGVGDDCAGGAGDGEAPGWDFVFGEGSHCVCIVSFFFFQVVGFGGLGRRDVGGGIFLGCECWVLEWVSGLVKLCPSYCC